jgi:hypothetical protein
MADEKRIVLDKDDLFFSVTPITTKHNETYHYVWWYLKQHPETKMRKLCITQKDVEALLAEVVAKMRS